VVRAPAAGVSYLEGPREMPIVSDHKKKKEHCISAFGKDA